MPTALFIHQGSSIDYTPAVDVVAGDVVVQEELVGVVKLDIPANKLGALAVTGVFDFPKATGGGTAIVIGSNVYWDAVAKQASTMAGGNKLIGKTVLAAADDDETVRVRMSQ